jgi:hypothetical protein
MNLLYSLPDVLQNEVFSYNPEHREKMKSVLRSINTCIRCDVCSTVIIKYTVSSPIATEICCTEKCLDEWFNYIYYH